MIDSTLFACVTGGCGFIGTHLVENLLSRGCRVRVFDNLSVGKTSNLPTHKNLEFHEGDVRNRQSVDTALRGCNFVFHLAAPTDVRRALADPWHDMDHGATGTQVLLEGMRNLDIRRLVFASSSCVYGSDLSQPAAESMGPLLPSSIYGASKLAAEGLIAAYCKTFDLQSWIFRFPNVVGPGLTHGVILDFVDRLIANPERLTVYGDGRQTKTYLWVEDCISGILHLTESTSQPINVFNVTTHGSTSVNQIAALISVALDRPPAELQHTGGEGGWRGDVPYIVLDLTKAAAAGWKARYTSDQGVAKTIQALLEERKSLA